MKSALSLVVFALGLASAVPTALAGHGSSSNRLTRKHQQRAAAMAARDEMALDHELVAKRSNIEVRDEHNVTLTKRAFTGRGTFYYTDVGLGACGQLSQNNEWTVALNTAQYGGGYPGPECFKYISISANGQTRSGIQIRDQCPTCGYGDLDLAPGLFTQFADEGAGVISITWWFDGQDSPQPSPSPEPEPTSTWSPPPPPPPSTTSTSEWHPPSTSTSQWVEPTPSSTWSPPPPSSTPPASSSAAPSSSYVASSSTNSTSLNPFAVVSSYEASSTGSASASASASASGSGTDGSGAGSANGANQVPLVYGTNLQAINGLVTNYGQIMVVAGGAAPAA